MSIRESLNALRRWSQSSLANTFALRAALIAIVSSLVVALISLTVIYWVERTTHHQHLQERAGRFAERFESSIDIVESTALALARNPMFITALLDSRGRDSYVAPFLDNYKFPISVASGLALCDINGERLAGMRSPLSQCRANSTLFRQVATGGKTARELVTLQDGRIAWTIYQGIVFEYTGTTEGVVVTQVDLHDLLRSVPDDLDLASVALAQAGSAETLVSANAAGAATESLHEAKMLLFKGAADKAPFPLEVVVRDDLSAFKNKLIPLVSGYGLGIFLLVLSVLYWTRRVSRILIAPLTELTRISHQVAETGDLTIDVPQSNDGEVQQLAKTFEVMINALRTSRSSLEEKVALRTAELTLSEATTRDRTEQLNAIFDLSPDGFVSFDADLRVAFVNKAFLRITGFEAIEIDGVHEKVFSELLAKKCLSNAVFPGVAALRAARKEVTNGSTDAGNGKVRHDRIELAGPGHRVLEVGIRLSRTENVSQILYLRDVTHEAVVDRMKSEFLSTAAHELRTPMASIYGYTELLLQHDFDEGDRKDMLSRVFAQSELMVSIINELLDLARIEAQQGKDFVVERLSLQEIVAEAVAGFKLPPGRNSPLIDATDSPLFVRADRKKMQQAILNLLSNAYKYSSDVDAVCIAYRSAENRQDGMVGIEVSDHGIGMSVEEMERVYERFYRADTSGKIPGTGLGMSIVKEIVELHGGEVKLDSKVGAGTTVTLWLPAV